MGFGDIVSWYFVIGASVSIIFGLAIYTIIKIFKLDEDTPDKEIAATAIKLLVLWPLGVYIVYLMFKGMK